MTKDEAITPVKRRWRVVYEYDRQGKRVSDEREVWATTRESAINRVWHAAGKPWGYRTFEVERLE